MRSHTVTVTHVSSPLYRARESYTIIDRAGWLPALHLNQVLDLTQEPRVNLGLVLYGAHGNAQLDRIVEMKQAVPRRELKRMKNKQKRSMAQMSFEMRKLQTEGLLQNQMAQYKAQMAMAEADGVISPAEQTILNQQQYQMQQTAQAGGMQNMDIEELARQLGIDRFRLGPIPIGPKLTIAQQPTRNVTMRPLASLDESNKLDLNPSNETSAEAKAQKALQ